MSLGNGNIHQQGDIPEIVKLPNNRIRVIRRFQKFNREDVDNANLGSLMGDFGALDTVDEQILNQGYTNCRLISVEVDNRFNSQANSDNPVLVKTYETLTGVFVETSSDTTEISENNLKKITRVYRAASGTTSDGVVGTTPLNPTADPSDGIILASSSIEDNTAFAELTEVYLESGTLSEVTDEVGPQKSKIIQTIGIDPEAPDGYVLAKKEESNFEGLETNSFTFLKNNVVLSVSEDRVGSQLAVTNEVFKPTSDVFAGVDVANAALSGYEEADRRKSDFAGIPTIQYRFLKEDVQLSKSVDNESPLKTETREYFKPDASKETLAGYSLVDKQESDVDGIPTERYTFAKNNVTLSVTEDKVGSQNAIVNEIFNPSSESITGVDTNNVALIGYGEADRTESNYDGIKTIRIRFLEENVQLSRSVDNKSSLKTEVREYFKPDSSKATLTDYSLVNKQESNVDGIPTERYTFALDNVMLSISNDKVGSQLAIVEEYFKPDHSRLVKEDYVLADAQQSDVQGIPTERYTFLKEDVQLSDSEDAVGSQLAVVQEWFKPSSSRETKLNYSLARKEESNVDGIPTLIYTFLKDDVQLSKSEDKVGSQQAITEQWFNPVISDPSATPPVVGRDAKSSYSLAKEEASDFNGIPTVSYIFVKSNVVLSVTQDRVASQLSVINEVFNPVDEEFSGQDAEGNPLVEYAEASRTKSDHDGKPTLRYQFVKKDVMLSRSEDSVGSQNAIIEEWFHPETFRYVKAGYQLGKEEKSEVEGIPTSRFTFLRPCILSASVETQSNGKLTIETIESFFKDPISSTGGALIGEEESNVDGIKSKRFTFAKGLGQISVEKEPAPAQLAGCTYVTVKSYGTPVSPTGAPVFESETEADGFMVYERTSLQGNITGVKQSYTDVVEVTDAGTVNCTAVNAQAGSVGGTIAVAKVVPPTTKSLAAKVTVEITTSPPVTTQLAYDLGDVSCSVVSTSLSEDFRGSDIFTSKSGRMRFSGARKSADMSARVNTYPNSYLTSSLSSGKFEYISSYENGSQETRNINAVAQYSTTTTDCIGTGAVGKTYQTTGIIRRESRPVLTDLNKITYYEVITYTI